jgi:glucokinase
MKVIGIDLGGTKVAAAVVNEKGKILDERWEPTQLEGGWKSLRAQLVDICRAFRKKHGRLRGVGIGSAGPLHAPSGKLLDPTNFGWKDPLTVPVAANLKSALKIPVYLENDAAAAVLAEHWKGKGGDDCVMLTLGTGLGVGVIAKGRLLRGGRGLHPEGGHLLLRSGDRSAPCGCGNFGCSEAFLSGKNFASRAGRLLGREEISGKELADLARAGDPKALALFAEYSALLADYLHNMVVLYYPKKVIFSGSFAQSHPLFLPAARARLQELIERRLKTLPLMPELRLSALENKAGILGGAYIALNPDYADSR